MRHPLTTILVLLLALGGCQSWKKDATNRDRYADAERTVETVTQAASLAFQNGKLKGEQLRLTKEAINEANLMLKAMNQSLKASDALNAEFWFGRLQSAITRARLYMSTEGASQ